MKTTKKLIAAAVAATLLASPFASIVHAAEPAPAPTEAAGAPANPADPGARPSPILKTVDEAGQAIREIQQARIALFQGETDAAAKLVSAANDNLGAARKLVGEHGIERTDATGGGKDAGKGGGQHGAKGPADAWLPLQTSFALAEGFVPAEQHQDTLQKAGSQMQGGDERGAAESLRLGEIDFALSAAMLPANASLKHVQDAERLIGEKKFFEANLALKAVEDSVVVETWSAAAIPTQGIDGQGVPGDAAQAPSQG